MLTTLVRDLVTARKVPSVLVAHELAEAQAFADRLAVLDRGRVLQSGAPDEVVRRPATRRVAELVGYLAFVPGANDLVAGIHPERTVAGALPQRGLVLAGPVVAVRPAGAGWEAELQVAGEVVTCRLPDRPAAAVRELVVTALDPPWFGPDGTVAARPAPGEQVGA